MAPHLQPLPLSCIAHRKVAENLANICQVLHTLAQETCVNHVLNLTRTSLRPYWQSTVPAAIRTKLLEDTTSLLNTQSVDSAVGTSTGAAPLYLLALLFSNDVKKIRIELCCYYGCSHQTALLKFLATEGRGLESLELARSTLLRLDRTLLQSVLTSASNLRHLTFKNIANDSILQLVGAHCPHLESLDVSHSREVTDIGLQQLFLKIEIRDKSTKSKASKRRNTKDSLGLYKGGIHSATKLLRKLYTNLVGRSAKEPLTLLEYCESRNRLCSTLRRLDIANTAVTHAGIVLTLLNVPQLQSFGEYCHLGRALESLHKDHQIHLRCASCSRPTDRNMEAISRFVELRKLKITEPAFVAESLFNIPPTVVSLTIHSVPSTWLPSITAYLNVAGKSLQELSLRFFPGDTLPTVNLDEFMPACHNLVSLCVDGANVDWRMPTATTFQHLAKIQLGKVVTANALYNVLKHSPKLRIAHVYSCNQIEEMLQEPSIFSHLHCFYIYETACLTKETIQCIVEKATHVQKIGNIRNCGLTPHEVQSLDEWIVKCNYDVQLNAGSHWFSSSCFPL